MEQLHHRWPPLFKKAKDGKIQTWQVWVIDNVIHTRSGFVGMKMRETTDVVKSGKNIGKKNETTPHDQAIFEAQSRLEKQIDKGYVYDALDANEGKVDKSVVGGFFPMLAHSFDKHESKIDFPCYVQPKLDGLRATSQHGKFFSRTRKPFASLGHIQKVIIDDQIHGYPFDGELYCHELKDEFEEIVSAVKREKSDNPKTKLIEYHVYDIAWPDMPFAERTQRLHDILGPLTKSGNVPIKLVETRIANNKKELMKHYEEFMEKGYEGAMVRSAFGHYEHRRSYHLQKLKQFQDDEFQIVGIMEGRGALAGHAAAFVCVIHDQHGERTFEAKLSGKNVTKFLKQCYEDASHWRGKWLKVQYQGWTTRNKVPRFPVGLHIREAE